jgi:hypothetical protein
MTAKPPIPPEQRAFKGQKPDIAGEAPKTRDAKPETQGAQANIRQNLTPQRSVQDR